MSVQLTKRRMRKPSSATRSPGEPDHPVSCCCIPPNVAMKIAGPKLKRVLECFPALQRRPEAPPKLKAPSHSSLGWAVFWPQREFKPQFPLIAPHRLSTACVREPPANSLSIAPSPKEAPTAGRPSRTGGGGGGMRAGQWHGPGIHCNSRLKWNATR